jgi:hypothetical protein
MLAICNRDVAREILDDDVATSYSWPAPPTQLLGMSKNEGPSPQSPPRIPGFTRLSSKIYNLKYALIDDSSLSSATMAKSHALQSNLDVDYVISYRFAKTGMFKALAWWQIEG